MHDIAFNGLAQRLGIDDEPAIVRNGELASPDPPGPGIHFDVCHYGNDSVAALSVSDSLPVQQLGLTRSLGVRRHGAGYPTGPFSRRFHDRSVARCTDVSQAELDRICAHLVRDLVDELLTAEMHFRPERVAHVGSPQRRVTIE